MRKGENIRKRKDGRWEARYFHKLKQKYVSVYAKTYTEVKEKVTLAKTENEIPVKIINHELNVEQASILYLFDCKHIVKRSTYAKYYDIIYNHIIPTIGNKRLVNLEQKDIDNFIKNKLLYGRKDSKGGLSCKTVKDITNILNQCLKKNDLHFVYKIPLKTQVEIKVLTNREYNTFLAYLLLDTDHEKLGLLITLFCGLRIGELCALKWSNIDLTEGTIKVTHTLQRIKNIDSSIKSKTIIIIDTPKTANAVRTIPLQTFLIEKMKKLKQQNDYYILTGTRKYIEPRTLQKRFKKHLEPCNIEDINFHALRHTFATKAIENQFDLKSLSEILGHYDAKFTISRYVHSSLEQKRIQMEKLNFNF